MNMCKGLCESYKLTSFKSTKRYEENQKRCSKCDVYIVSSDVRCPCCRCKLRITPRENKARKTLLEKKDRLRN